MTPGEARTRRQVPLRAALAAGLLGVAACSTCDGARAPTVVRDPGPLGLARAFGPVEVRALHFGDFGDPTPQQAAVARGIAAAHRRAPFDVALHAGDNIYECGPDPSLPGAERCEFAADGNTVPAGYQPPADPLFESAFERALEPLVRPDGSPVPVYLALGNHDVNARVHCLRLGYPRPSRVARRRACLEVARRAPRWNMPGRHYVLDQGAARFIVVDSNLLLGDYGGFRFEDEVAFVRDAAAGCADRHCFLVAHHPAVTAGIHRDDATPQYLSRVRRLEEAAEGRLAAWLAGHDHDLQHLRSASGLDVLVSGNGSRARDERFDRVSAPGARLLFASGAWGFAVLEVNADRWAARFEDHRGEALHCCAAERGADCEPIACARGDGAAP